MSLPAHTNEVGTSTRFNTGFDAKVGQGFGQTVNDYRVYTGMTEAYSYKSAKATGIRPGDPWKYPTAYERKIAKILNDSQVVIRDDDGRTYGYTYTRSGQHLSLPFWPNDPSGLGGVLNNAENKSVNDCLLALRGEKGGEDSERVRMQLGADVAEARKTADMIADTTKSVLYAYRSVKNSNFALAAKHLGISPGKVLDGTAPAKVWLQYTYGWKPLMGSIYDLNSRLNESLRDKLHLFSAVSHAGDQIQERRTYPHTLQCHHEAIFSYDCKVKTELYYTIKSNVIDQIDSFGLLNPLSIAWELAPLSFVLDWFIPVGNTLAALSATAGLEFHSGYQSTTERRSLSSRVVRNDNANSSIRLISGGSYHWESFRFSRRPFTSFPLPRLYANRNPFSTSHVVSALALLRQLL